MNKYNDLDMFFGNLIIFKDNTFKLYKNNVTLIYNGEENYFLLFDNEMIGLFDDLIRGLDNSLEKIDEIYEERKFYLTPKKEEGYVFIDESSLVKVSGKKGKNR